MSDESAYTIAAITVAAFGGPTWAVVLLFIGVAITLVTSRLP